MRTQRHSFVATTDEPQTDAAAMPGDPAGWCAALLPGRWLVEAGSHPPPAHQPARLLAGAFVPGGQPVMAISLRSGSLLPVDLGPALMQVVAAQGCPVPPLAGVALHELLLNAAIHGNLAVASGASQAWAEFPTREGRIRAALGDPLRAERVVTVAAAWDARRLVAVVADQGDGYDAARSDQAPRHASGRGLLIARSVARVQVRRGGRVHRLVFDLAPPEPG